MIPSIERRRGGWASVVSGPFFQKDFQTKYKTPPSSRPRSYAQIWNSTYENLDVI